MIIQKKLWYSAIMKLCFGLYSWLFSISWNVTKALFVTKTWQNLEFLKMQSFKLLWKWTTSHSSDFRIELNNAHICTLHRISSKNVDFNICDGSPFQKNWRTLYGHEFLSLVLVFISSRCLEPVGLTKKLSPNRIMSFGAANSTHFCWVLRIL